jgi:sortase (surface protein transpeptidase)
MRSRPIALVALLASLALVAGSVVAWALLRDDGVGTDLEQVTQARAAGSERPERSVERATQDDPPAEPALPQITEGFVDATVIPTEEVAEPPQRVSIPSVGIDLPVVATGVAGDGQMELPEDPKVMGWYKFGPQPGEDQGSTVLGGHVDSIEYGVGPLSRLANVQPGTEVTVTGPDGTVLRYQVRTVERIYKAALPVDELFTPEGPHQLAVVTCGGEFLGTGLGYEDNIVVIADPVA